MKPEKLEFMSRGSPNIHGQFPVSGHLFMIPPIPCLWSRQSPVYDPANTQANTQANTNQANTNNHVANPPEHPEHQHAEHPEHQHAEHPEHQHAEHPEHQHAEHPEHQPAELIHWNEQYGLLELLYNIEPWF
jgi:hypothetical protein